MGGHITILDEIEGLLAAAGDDPAALAQIEDTLTSGYARALALEAERLRLEQQLGTVVAGLGGRDAADRADELKQLAERMSRADGDIDRLRSLLGALRDRARALRAAIPPAATA